jgi:ssDNA-binding Zn-finger/Zn-ribbon topoisomerase 1
MDLSEEEALLTLKHIRYKGHMKSSIFGPLMEILEDNEDDLEVVVRCLNCGQPTKYGNTRMISGFVGCDNKIKVDGKEMRCYYDDLMPRVLYAHEHDYETYHKGKFYRYYDNLGGLENEQS